jgi:RNA polymerase sigma-70 factor (ECF subfamily)
MDDCPAAWRDLFRSHGGTLVLYARQWLPDRASAEDAVQEGLVRCWKLQPGRAPDPALIYVAVRTAALDLLKSRRRRLAREERVARPEAEHWWHDDDLVRKERAAAIQTALEHLPIEQREALVLRIWGGLSIAETARVLAANPNTVAGRCRQALVSLAAVLPEECHEGV